MTMSTPEPPAPTPSATTCANCGHEHPRQVDRMENFCFAPLGPHGARRQAVCGCKSFRPVPPASAPAATAEEQHFAVMEEGHKLTGDYIREHFVDEDDDQPAATAGTEPLVIADPSVPRNEVHFRDARGKTVGKIVNLAPAAPTAEEAETPSGDAEYLRGLAADSGEIVCECLTIHRTAIADSGRLYAIADRLTTQATALAALREAAARFVECQYDETEHDDSSNNREYRDAEQALRAALAPRQTTGDEHG